MLGRRSELDRVSSLIGGARNGRGGALLVRGDLGVGKTALLDQAIGNAGGMRLVRADGYEAESTMAYAALQRIGAPMAAHLQELPATQVAALRIAAGLDGGPPPDRYLVGLGMLSLLAAAGAAQPLVCVVDDAHLVDAESLEILAFVARRLKAESIALLLTTRHDARVDVAAAGLPRLDLGGLDPVSAVQLLDRSASGPLDPLIARQIAEETLGNPLALIDLGREFTARQLTDSWISPMPVPIGLRLETHYLGLVEEIPDVAQLWLRVAAAESSGNAIVIDRAASRLGVPAGAAAGAERARLASVHDTVTFRHPLVRAAVYHAMTAADRLRVHGALRDVADELGRPDLAVWHASAAAVGSDDAVAARVEQAADDAGARGGSASRARLLSRAADLTPAGPVRDGRLLAAAEASAAAGGARMALGLLDRLDATGLDPVGAGRARSLRVMLAMFVADPAGITGGAATLLRAADLFHGVAPELEQRALVRAFEMALTAEWAMEDLTLPELGRRLAEGVAVADGSHAVALRALSAHILLPYEEAVPSMRAAVEMLQTADDADLLDLGHFGIALTMALWDERACVELLERTAQVARAAGLLRVLDTTLWLLGLVELVRGDPAASGRYIEQVRDLRTAIGYDAEQVVNASYLAWAGAPTTQVELIAKGILATGFGGAWTVAMTGLSVRQLADGHYRDAFERLRPMVDTPFLQVSYQQLPELVEAGVRSGNSAAARSAADRLAVFAAASGTPWARGVAERAAALLAPDAEAEDRYVRAIEHLRRTTAPGELGRGHLLYGEWLRRVKRRREAREQLRLALAIFERVAAPAFADRARRELAATGEHVLRNEPGDGGLTPQEATIAGMAANGQTNAEIGAALFISTNTVDYHLRKVFRKLAVTSRRQLAEHLTSP
ncbi:LuxR C-terminal-related transcriptional regulator [Pengzhenrongella frigida]|uniref:LuxR C-terminal-related transcriptional regulator n=1 Tax=Pengzhenrongella frigida TaxID=1259133 RepID=UPI00210575ED|nr:LuxR family transcriptional regulator [Cellulomonas sp. HLT2-17]